MTSTSQLKKDITTIFNENYKIYGYRRIHLALKNKGITVSEKVIRKIMKQNGLIAYQPHTNQGRENIFHIWVK